MYFLILCFFFFLDPAPTSIYTSCPSLSLNDALPISLLFMRRSRNLGAGLSIAGTAGSLAIAIALFLQAMDGGPSAYALGGWPAPFGIILVLDRLAAMMLDRKSTRLNSSH